MKTEEEVRDRVAHFRQLLARGDEISPMARDRWLDAVQVLRWVLGETDTTPPGSREVSFYSAPVTDPDPQLLALDEATKETVTTAELRTTGSVLTSGASFAIRVPVLMVVGQFDPGVCGGASICASLPAIAAAFVPAEAPFFAREACLETVVIEDTGHYLNLEPTAPATYAAIRAWSDALVGLYQPAPRCRPGLPFRRTYSRNSASDPENRNGLRRPDRDAPAPRPHRVGVPG